MERDVEEQIEDHVEAAAEAQVEDAVDEDVEQVVEPEFGEEVDDRDGESESEGVSSTDQQDQTEHDDDDDGDAIKKVSAAEREWRDTERASTNRDVGVVGDSIELRGIARDVDGFEVARDEWLIAATNKELALLAENGFRLRAVEEIGLLGESLARIEAPGGADDEKTEQRIRAIAPDAIIDRNHLYSPQAARSGSGEGAVRPRDVFALPSAADRLTKPIGLIDTAVAKGVPALRRARVSRMDFVTSNNQRPNEHGTAIASILVGRDGSYVGLLPSGALYAASVFEDLPGRPGTATTASLVRALDWMAKQGVGVVSMSLTGPHNRILQQAIIRTRARGVTVIAAIGNAGPHARPLYPAGYRDVISVTALTPDRQVYRMANRGAYLDFAAPGVGILHAGPRGGYVTSSGTSMAVPFVAAALLLSTDRNGRSNAGIEERLKRFAIDLGPAGFDEIYGNGLIQPLP
ncbi:S8 family serine peptidase [Sphingopyxis sp. LC81]|uniref:S8 family serine peptidase n=1 Tax=Sphingopyxis sp. LC81 TaxID=1502850 RepID=UPI001269E00C|nr:S8 family serine peptidase [Sphingopyxis sp. LC81]